MLRTFLTELLIELGEMDRAEAMAQDAIQRARKVDHFYSLANISHVLARLRTAQGRHMEGLSLLQECWQTCLDLEIVQMYPIFAARMGEAYLAAGNIDAAIEILSVPERLDVPLAEHAFGWRYLFVAQGRAFLATGGMRTPRPRRNGHWHLPRSAENHRNRLMPISCWAMLKAYPAAAIGAKQNCITGGRSNLQRSAACGH